jgi:hypothetical protein
MKRVILALMVLCAGMATQAQPQTIHVGHKFWDGDNLYTVKEIRMGKYFYMTTRTGLTVFTTINRSIYATKKVRNPLFE